MAGGGIWQRGEGRGRTKKAKRRGRQIIVEMKGLGPWKLLGRVEGGSSEKKEGRLPH